MANPTKEQILAAVVKAVGGRVGRRGENHMGVLLDLANESDFSLEVLMDETKGELVVVDVYPGREHARFKIVPA
jgi:hypothetical protein